MFPRKIDKVLTLSLLSQQHVRSLFALPDCNREFLRPWFPWIENTIQEKDTEKFIDDQNKLYLDKKAIQVVIAYENKIIGMVDYHEIDLENEKGILDIGWVRNSMGMDS